MIQTTDLILFQWNQFTHKLQIQMTTWQHATLDNDLVAHATSNDLARYISSNVILVELNI